MRHLLLDLDHTLYPPDNGLLAEIHRRMEKFVVEELRVSPGEAARLRDLFRDRHGTTMRGLMLDHGVEPNRFLSAIHDGLPGDFLSPDRTLQSVLGSYAGPIHVFSNAPGDYVRRALDRLGIASRVDRVFDIEFSLYDGKPQASAYERVERALQAPPGDLIFIDDSPENVRSALARGWRAAWISHGKAASDLPTLASPSAIGPFLQALARERGAA